MLRLDRLGTFFCSRQPGLVALAAVAASCTLVACGESHMGGAVEAGADGGPVFGDCSCGPPPWGDTGPMPDVPLPIDDAPPVDGGGAPSCDADDARAILCPAGICDGLDSFAWDGERCIRIDCGTCEGADCGGLARSPEECQARHAECVPEQCRATGGDWLFFAEECFHYRCGVSQPAPCLVGRPVCNCGAGRSFVDGVGCEDDPSCALVDPLPPDLLCANTGGTWTDGICCSTVCGQFCPLACAAPGCVCGAMEIFDGLNGCTPGAECFEREAGQSCDGARTRCADGLICCEHCGGAGCDPTMTCEAPVCDADPNIDECGNNLLAP